MKIEDPILDFISAASQSFVTAYTIVATCETPEGNQTFWLLSLKNQTASTTLGLLESAAAAQKYTIARSFQKPE